MKAHVELVKEWLNKCPILENENIKTEFLHADEESSRYSLEQNQVPNGLTKANVIGTKLNGTLSFTLAGRYDFDIITDDENNKNIKTIQNIVDWLMLQELTKNYPKLNEDETVTEVAVTSSPFLFGVNNNQNYSRYQFTFQIKYEKRV